MSYACSKLNGDLGSGKSCGENYAIWGLFEYGAALQ